jgi:hypothetical protein
MSFDPQYASQALAWLAVWGAGGLTVRQWLASKEDARRRSAGTKQPR